jgi:23S rRNA (guanosine2251-2'-O)-methyltransferase
MAQFIYGKNTVLGAISNASVEKVYITHQFKDDRVLTLLKQHHIPVERVDEKRLDSFVSGNHQGMVATVKSFTYLSLPEVLAKVNPIQQPLILMIDSLQDPQNFGAIIRNAAGLGVQAIIIKKDGQVGVTNTVMKIASGALSLVDICEVTNLSMTIETLKKSRFWIVASMLSTTAIDYRSFDYRQPICLILGSEGKGISPLVAKHADVHVTIPMTSTLQSLNVASSSAILLAQIYQQRFPL